MSFTCHSHKSQLLFGFIFWLATMTVNACADEYGLNLSLYDDFSTGEIDQTKWSENEYVRRIENGSLIFESEGVNVRNYLNFRDPDSITSSAADVLLIRHSGDSDCSARLGGVYYNDGTTGAAPGSQVGDIYSNVKLHYNKAAYVIERMPDDYLYTTTTLGTTSVGTAYTLFKSWDPNSNLFGFQLGNDTPVYVDVSTTAPVAQTYANAPFKNIGTRLVTGTDQAGYITASFDNVMINGSQYDDFSTGAIDLEKWTDGEYVRTVTNGQLVMGRRSADSNKSAMLQFANPSAITAMYTEVTLTEAEKTGTYPARARLGGRFYNDTPGSTSGTGEIWAEIHIADGHAGYIVSRSLNDDMSSYSPVSGNGTTADVEIGTVAIGETHRLYMQWDGALFAFQLDDQPVYFFDPVAAGSPIINPVPNKIYRGVGIRNTLQEGTMSSATATYDNVRIGSAQSISANSSQTTSPPNAPTLSSPINEESDTSLTPTLTTAAFSDSDNGDTHLKTDWLLSVSTDFTTPTLSQSSFTNLTTITVPDGMLDEGTTYYWKSQFYDQDSNASGWSSTYSFTTLTTNTDQNNNGVPDSQDVSTSVDLDSDGEADIQQDDIKSLNTVVGEAQIGISRKTDPVITKIVKVESIDPDTISTTARPHTMPLGMISLKLNVPLGSTATPTIYFSEAAPTSAIWLMYDSINGWTDYSNYATFSDDRKSVVLELQDGSHGDADGIANGIIVDPGGYGLATFISGTVTDKIGATITNAEITMTRALTELSFAIKSLSDGTFFSALLPGNYTYNVSASGYGSYSGSIAIQETVVKTSFDISLVAAPILTTSINGSTATASWGAVPNAEKYTFYYAPYPYGGEHTITSLEMSTQRSISAELPSGAAYYVAVTSWVDGVQSGYSNIGLIIMP